jgi:hypothetical protein
MYVVRLRAPVLALVLAATAFPVGLRSPQQVEWNLLNTGPADVALNIASFVPVGIVLATLGPVRAVMAAALISAVVEICQIAMIFREPTVLDVVSNAVGALLGAVIATRWNVTPQFQVDGRMGGLAAVLALVLIAGVWIWKTGGSLAAGLGTTTAGRGALEARWTFGERGGRIARDASRHGHDGEYRGTPNWTTGPMGPAVRFDGADDYVDLGSRKALRLNGSMTISAWIKPAANRHDDEVIISTYSAAGFQFDTTIDTGPRTIGFKLGNSCGTLMARYGATQLALDAWHHLAGVYDAEARTIDVYLNGKLDNGVLKGPVTSAQSSRRGRLYIGRRDLPGFGFLGEIGDVRVYSLALTPAEIAASMHRPEPAVAARPRAEAGREGTEARAAERTGQCIGTPDRDDARLPAAAAAFGALVAIACAGLLPAGGPLLCLIAGVAAGSLFVPLTGTVLTGLTMQFLSMVGGASVAFTMRRS